VSGSVLSERVKAVSGAEGDVEDWVKRATLADANSKAATCAAAHFLYTISWKITASRSWNQR
jgi:hypothetical protein